MRRFVIRPSRLRNMSSRDNAQTGSGANRVILGAIYLGVAVTVAAWLITKLLGGG
jgi:hypothetical protein